MQAPESSVDGRSDELSGASVSLRLVGPVGSRCRPDRPAGNDARVEACTSALVRSAVSAAHYAAPP